MFVGIGIRAKIFMGSARSLAFSFQERVMAAGGVVEAYDCLVLDLHRLQIL